MMTAEQLKDSILLLAMQGKLDTECASDKSITDVLKEIYKGKGNIKPIDQDQIPYDLPQRWEWARLENITDDCDNPFADGPFGSNLKKEHYTDNHEVRIIQLSNIGEKGWKDKNEKYTTYEHLKTIERSKVNAGDIVIAKMMPAGRAIEVPESDCAYVLSSDAVKFVAHPLLNKRFLLLAINSPVFREQVYSEVHGVTRVRTSLKKLRSYIVPLPPVEEQQRIVTKIEEMMPFVEQYAEASTKLNSLNTSFPDMMKKSILQEAVQGKLVPQDPNDEPASELMKRIAEEKKRLIKEGKIKKQKKDYTFSVDDIPFDIPDNWAWARLGDICYDLRYGTASKSSKTGDVIVLRMGNIQDGEIDYTDLVYSSNKEDNNKYKLEPLDILFNRTNSRDLVGKTGIYRGEHPAIFAGYLVQVRPIEIDPEYLNYVMNSEYERNYCKDVKSDGINQSNVNATKIGQFLIPIPPINEQHRIVDQLNGILPMVKVYQQKYGI